MTMPLPLTVIVPAVTDPKLPQSFSVPLAYGDLFATALAFLALAAVRLRWPLALALVWLFSVEGSLDLVKAVVQVAKSLGYKTIAEYVGDEATVLALKHYGVDFMQGYHVGKPRALNPASSGSL